MKDNNSFLYPQGFHIGALYYIVKNIGDGNFRFPFNPTTYCPKGELDGFQRECRYRMWALMEMGILEDHRMTNDHLSYQHLTERGKRIYLLMKSVVFPPNFFKRRNRKSWAMQLSPEEYIKFTQGLKTTHPELFSELHQTITSMASAQDLVGYFILTGKYSIEKNYLYKNYFENPLIRQTYKDRELTPPKESDATASRRIAVLLGLLQSVGVMEGYSVPRKEPISLVETTENISKPRMKEIEKIAEESVADVSKPTDIKQKLGELERTLSKLSPMVRARSQEQSQSESQPEYPRNMVMVALLKKQANYTCQICGIEGFQKPDGKKFISHHHMVPMNKGGELGSNPDIPSNIIIACSWCHDKLEYGELPLKMKIYQSLLRRDVITQEKIEQLTRLNLL